jgi:hypothetical protein
MRWTRPEDKKSSPVVPLPGDGADCRTVATAVVETEKWVVFWWEVTKKGELTLLCRETQLTILVSSAFSSQPPVRTPFPLFACLAPASRGTPDSGVPTRPGVTSHFW